MYILCLTSTTNSASNMVKGARELSRSVSEGRSRDLPPVTVPCLAHWIQLMINGSLDEVLTLNASDAIKAAKGFMKTHYAQLQQATECNLATHIRSEVWSIFVAIRFVISTHTTRSFKT